MQKDFEGYGEMSDLLSEWKTDPQGIKKTFTILEENILSKEKAVISFVSRPGVSYSLRGTIRGDDKGEERLFVMADIIDDDPDNRWLSVCFYGDYITDEEGLGDLIPGGLLGEDGYCFDIYENEEDMVSFVNDKINESYGNTLASFAGD